MATGDWGRGDAEGLAGGLLAERPDAGNALRLAHEWLVTQPPQVYETRAGRRIGNGLVAQVERRVHQIRLLDDHVGGLNTYDLAAAELTATMTVLRESAYPQEIGRRLLAVIGELCQLAGWTAADAGLRHQAVRCYLTGLRASHAGADVAGAANNLSCLSYLFANSGDPGTAALMATSAFMGARREVTATTRALLLERVAWARARTGDVNATGRALGEVEQAYAAREPAEDPVWTYWLDPDEIAIMAGRCWTELRRPMRAVPALRQAIDGYTEQTARETALYLAWLAQAYLQANEIEQAARTARRALTLAGRARSARVDDRLMLLRTEFARLPDHPESTAFIDACRE